MSNEAAEATNEHSSTWCGWCGAPLMEQFATSPTRLLVTLGPQTPQDRIRIQYCEVCWDNHVARVHQHEKRNRTWNSTDDRREACGWCGGLVTCRESTETSLEVVFEDHSESTWARHETQYCRFCRDQHARQAYEFTDSEEPDTEDGGGDGV
jgi:hypothetical protein